MFDHAQSFAIGLLGAEKEWVPSPGTAGLLAASSAGGGGAFVGWFVCVCNL